VKDIRQNISISEQIAEQVHKNRTPILGFIVLVLVVIASYSIYNNYHEKYETEAQAVLFEAERLFNANLSMGEFAKETSKEPTKVDTTQVEEKLSSIVNEFPKTKARMQASTLLAQIYLNNGDNSKAVEVLEQSFQHFSGDLIDTLVGLKLTNLYEKNKQCDKALPVLEKLTKSDVQEFKPEAILRQGLCEEILGNAEKAKQSFQKLATEYGDTVQGQQAQKYLKIM